jgi:Spore coat assembly protein
VHTNYKLSARGEVLALFDNGGRLLDRYNIRSVPVGASVGRVDSENALVYFKEPTPGTANASPSKGAVSAPVTGVAAGSYDAAQQVTLSCKTEGAVIYYTTDGTEPTQGSARYTGAIPVGATGMIRAKAYRDGYIESDVLTATYLIGDAHDLPVVSLVTDPDLLFGTEHGIYTNFSQKWEVPASMELIEDGRAVFAQNIGLRLFGAYSRSDDQKSFAIFARSKYGGSSMSYPFFESQPFTEYKSIVLRAGGNDGKLTKLRDVLGADLAAGELDVEYMDYRACIVYLNGQYWGVYYMREKVNKYYLAQHYDIERLDSIDLLVGDGAVLAGDNADYKALIEFCKNNSLAGQENFDYVASRIDTDSYMDWCIAEIFFSNADLGNVKFWRSPETGNKWRWILYDIDWGFYKVARKATNIFFSAEGRGANSMYSTELSRSMLENDAWREAFLRRFAQLLQTRFSTEYVTERLDGLAGEIGAERERDRRITGQSEGNFNTHMERLRCFTENRREVVVYELRRYFSLSEQETIDIFGTAGRAPTEWEIATYGE